MIETITSTDLMALDLQPPTQVVDRFLTVGLNILAGNPKAGKSFLALGLAVSVANGTPAMTTLKTVQGDVLYMALEDTHYRLRHRLKGMNHQVTPALRFATASNTFGDGSGVDDLDNYLAANPDTRMVIIDTLAKVKGESKGGNVYDEDSESAGALHALAHDHSIALVIVTHTRKAAAADFLHSVSGSSGLTGAADTISVLNRRRNETVAKLNVTGRDIREAEFDLEWYSPRGGWIVKDSIQPAFEDRRYGT